MGPAWHSNEVAREFTVPSCGCFQTSPRRRIISPPECILGTRCRAPDEHNADCEDLEDHVEALHPIRELKIDGESPVTRPLGQRYWAFHEWSSFLASPAPTSDCICRRAGHWRMLQTQFQCTSATQEDLIAEFNSSFTLTII